MPASNMFDTRLSKRTKHYPSNTRTKEMFQVFDRMFDSLQILSNTIKQHQTRSNSTKQGGQTVKFWSPSNVWWCLVAKHFPFVQGLKCLVSHTFQYVSINLLFSLLEKPRSKIKYSIIKIRSEIILFFFNCNYTKITKQNYTLPYLHITVYLIWFILSFMCNKFRVRYF